MREIEASRIAATVKLEAGDVVLFAYPRKASPRGLGWRAIEHVQKGLLADLGLKGPAVGEAARYTHVGMALHGGTAFAEMTTPCAGIGDWRRVPKGTVVLARRAAVWPEWSQGLMDAPWEKRLGAANLAKQDAFADTPYPYLELLSYWVWHLWIGKLWLGRRFRELFADDTRDVCSGSVWRWLWTAGLNRDLEGTTDAMPEAWYPARLAADTVRFQDVEKFTVK